MGRNIKAYGIALYKIENKKVKLLLCKSVKSQNRWGFLKGVQLGKESAKQCAKREFFEESSLDVKIEDFEEYFEQKNKQKDIGIWLVNAKNVKNLQKYFFEDKLNNNYLSWENSKVKFFDIEELPSFKKKQKELILKVKDFLKSKNQFH
ncbi:NUDIX hydrolase [Malaciobacter halophilus]|uniref:NUDIX hydrolase n=1 Tax=Malaciobacter halophilus TaxID=197482 RepID=A0A2N1J3B4_9BACT|nr:NUDIX domain-containing protein [Malaciobacter halophilus]AXH09164.1 putative diadenosine tetraphosphate hydrolase [Malaciobacter halophilus]PKI81041.1 NUDIX hydrolase [Malaciobacter halophilus]